MTETNFYAVVMVTDNKYHIKAHWFAFEEHGGEEWIVFYRYNGVGDADMVFAAKAALVELVEMVRLSDGQNVE